MFWDIAFSTIGGLDLFLFGIQIMASGMQKAAGDRFRRVLEVLTNKPVIGVLTGILVTILVQSSSTASVMVVGFANAGLMNLSQAISVIIGANIGTTVTAQIVSFKIGIIAFPAIGIGSLLNFFGRRRFQRYLGQTVLGFGLLFLGMDLMSGAIEPHRETLLPWLSAFDGGTWRGMLLGTLAAWAFTAVIQSSGATIAASGFFDKEGSKKLAWTGGFLEGTKTRRLRAKTGVNGSNSKAATTITAV